MQEKEVFFSKLYKCDQIMNEISNIKAPKSLLQSLIICIRW